MGTNARRKAASRRQFVALLVLALGVVGAFLWYQERYEDATKLRAAFTLPDGRTTGELKLELASTDAERAKGLMFRKPGSMAPNEGMLFIFPKASVHSFYMKNTYLPLDMIFLDESMRIVGILHDVPVLNEVSRSIGKPSQYVLELNAGVAKQIGLTEGAVLRVSGTLPKGA
jgi:uncharacterized membrane protein (UPF0127 family)